MRVRIAVVVHEAYAGLGRLGDFGLGAEALDVRHPALGDEVPADLDGYDGLVVLGGSMAAWEDESAPWLPATRRLLAEGVERGLPTLGICLGGQLLALATGGRVERGSAGLEVGMVDVDLTASAGVDPFFGAVQAELGDRFAPLEWHNDAIVELPPGGVRLVSGDRYPNQGFRLGERAWGVQYHPEVSAEDWAAWMAEGNGAVSQAGLDPEKVMAETEAAEAHLTAIAQAHANAFAAVVRQRS